MTGGRPEENCAKNSTFNFDKFVRKHRLSSTCYPSKSVAYFVWSIKAGEKEGKLNFATISLTRPAKLIILPMDGRQLLQQQKTNLAGFLSKEILESLEEQNCCSQWRWFVKCNLQAKEDLWGNVPKTSVSSNQELSFRVHGYVFPYSWEFIDWSQLDTTCLASKIQRLLHTIFSNLTDPALKAITSCNMQRSIDRKNESWLGLRTTVLAKVNPQSCCLTLRGS